MKITCGLILYRITNNKLEVFLVHPSGPVWGNKDLGVWSIPKGHPDENEDYKLTAVREFSEETGYSLQVNINYFKDLGEAELYKGKVMYCFAVEKDVGQIQVKSNNFEMEWPPKSGKIQSFPETDKGEYFDLNTARLKLNKNQLVFLERLETALR